MNLGVLLGRWCHVRVEPGEGDAIAGECRQIVGGFVMAHVGLPVLIVASPAGDLAQRAVAIVRLCQDGTGDGPCGAPRPAERAPGAER